MYDSGDEFKFGLLVGMSFATFIAISAYPWFHPITLLTSGITLILCIPYLVTQCTRNYLRAHRHHARERRYQSLQRKSSPVDRKRRIASQSHLRSVDSELDD